MTAKKNYTNADIMKRLDGLDNRMSTLETWKIAQDAGKAAVDEYRRQEATASRDSVFGSLKDFMPYIGIIIVGAAAIIYAYASRAH